MKDLNNLDVQVLVTNDYQVAIETPTGDGKNIVMTVDPDDAITLGTCLLRCGHKARNLDKTT
jgi:NAD-dependent dihydropyrimidine dehydrogenase PreA subunit